MSKQKAFSAEREPQGVLFHEYDPKLFPQFGNRGGLKLDFLILSCFFFIVCGDVLVAVLGGRQAARPARYIRGMRNPGTASLDHGPFLGENSPADALDLSVS